MSFRVHVTDRNDVLRLNGKRISFAVDNGDKRREFEGVLSAAASPMVIYTREIHMSRVGQTVLFKERERYMFTEDGVFEEWTLEDKLGYFVRSICWRLTAAKN